MRRTLLASAWEAWTQVLIPMATTGAVAYWRVGDIEKTLTSLVAVGAEELQKVRDVGRGKLIASVKDADGNIIGLMQLP